jgi:hypothetical protein
MTQGFTQGDDFVAARVSIDVPTEGIQSLREMSQGIDKFRTSVEAAARSSATFVGYIQQLKQAGDVATEAHRNLAAQLERTTDLQQRSMSGGGGNASQQLPLSRAAPQGYTDNFAGMGAGMGVRQGTPGGVSDQIQQQAIDPTRQLDPRKYINAQAGRHRVQGSDFTSPSEQGPVDLDATAGRIDARDRQQRETAQNAQSGSAAGMGGGGGWQRHMSTAAGLAGNIMSEMTPGQGSHMGMAHMAVGGLRALGGMLGSGNSRQSAAAPSGGSGPTAAQAAMDGGAEGMELGGGIGSMIGKAGVVGGAALAGFGLLQKGGSMIQGARNLGSIRGGGAAEGMETEAGIRSLALNPFLSTEQSRQIIMAGMTEGYSGKQFDTATQFMASNLKDMNIQVSDSVQMLRKNVTEGGASVAGLAASLSVLKESSKTGSMSLPDRIQAFKQGTANMIDSGINANSADQAMSQSLNGWDDDEALKGKFGQFTQGLFGTAQSSAMAETFSGVHAPGIAPEMAGSWLADQGVNMADVSDKAVTGAYTRIFGKLKPGSAPWINRVPQFRRLLAGMNMDMSNNDAKLLAQKLASGSHPGAEGKAKSQAIASEVNGPEGIGEDIGQTAGQVGASLQGLGGMAWNAVFGDDGQYDNSYNKMQKTKDQANYNTGAEATNPLIDTLVQQYGPRGVEVGGPGGWGALDGSKDQVDALAHGKMKWRKKGESGDGMSLADTPAQRGDGFRTNGGGNGQTSVQFSPAQVQIKIDGNGRATASPNPVQLTPNQQSTNGGGNSTMNDPPPGDGFGYYRGRGGWFGEGSG